jgi:hypothetical protein
VKLLNELEYIEGEIWANIWYKKQIVRIDPSNGLVMAAIDFENLIISGDVLNGIAYDHSTKKIFITGKRWPKLFEIKVERFEHKVTSKTVESTAESTTSRNLVFSVVVLAVISIAIAFAKRK